MDAEAGARRSGALTELTSVCPGTNHAARVAREMSAAFDVRACVIQRIDSKEWQFETVALGRQDDVSEHWLKQVAAGIAVGVFTTRRAVTINNLEARYPGEEFTSAAGINSYLGVPLFDSKAVVGGVLAVLGGAARQFDKADERWLQTVAQSIADISTHKELGEQPCSHEPAEGTTRVDAFREAISEQPKAGKPSVLLIDDDQAVNNMLRKFLSQEGYRVDSAFKGPEAMEMFQPSEHDVIITDIMMPDMNGWELVGALRVRAPEVPFVVITGNSSKDSWNEEHLRRLGVVAVLNKPLDLDQLASILQEHCRPR